MGKKPTQHEHDQDRQHALASGTDAGEAALANRETLVRARERAADARQAEADSREMELVRREELVRLREDALRVRAETDEFRADREKLLLQTRDANEKLVIATLRANELAEAANAARETLAGTIDALRETERKRKDEFIAMLGHELRNPLAPILTALDLMSMRDPNALERERTIICRQIDHLVHLVDDLWTSRGSPVERLISVASRSR